jgi:hypothetical protein
MKLLLLTAIFLLSNTGIYAQDHQTDKHILQGKKPHSHIHETAKKSTLTIKQTQQKSDIRIVAKGIVCSFCAQGVKKSFKQHKSVKKIEFNDTFGSMEVYLKKNKTISDKKIKKMIKDAGFEVTKIVRKKEK